MSFKTIGVIGAGVMGSDIAIDLVCKGFTIKLIDNDDNALALSKEIIRKNIREYSLINQKLKLIKAEDVLNKIEFTSNIEKANEFDFVIESISENLIAKKELYQQLDQLVRAEVIFASNTSCISITEIASFTARPANIIGIHFLNPVPLKQLVEVVKGYHTSDNTIKQVELFLKSIDKLPVLINDSFGFVSNRLSHLFMNEAAFLVLEGVSSPKEIDIIFKKGYGHAMGPLETADLIGLDTVVNSLEILYKSFQDSKYKCCPLLKKMVNAGVLGRKSGEGFYKY